MLKLKKSELTLLNMEQTLALGPNLLSGRFPEVKQLGDEEVTCEIVGVFTFDHLKLLTDEDNIPRHVDLRGTPCTLTYDAGEILTVDRIEIGGYSNGGGNFMLSDFELYASDTKDDLYDQKNCFVKYYRSADESKGGFSYDKAAGDYLCDVEGTCRYFGLKLNGSCPSDEIARISRVALFNNYTTFSNAYVTQQDVTDLFGEIMPQIKGDYSGCPSCLINNHICFDDETVTANSDITVIFNNDKLINAERIFVVGKNAKPQKITCDGKEVKFIAEETETFGGRTVYECKTDAICGNQVEISLNKGAVTDLMYCDTTVRNGFVDFADITDHDFMGAGGDVIPTHYTEYGLREGYNDVYFELEKHHISKVKPHAVRMWFQIDWMVDTHEQYLTGDWQFDTIEMDSVKRFCQAYMDEGVEIEFNFGWKIGAKIQDWFCIRGIDEGQKRNAAPADIYNYGKACAAVLEYLILDCGFHNIKYLTFYNEPTVRINPARSDFNTPGDPIAYMAAMIKYAEYFVEQSRVAGMVDIWAVEESSAHSEVMQKLNMLMPELFSMHTIHAYMLTYNEICKFYDEEIVPYKDGKPVMLTEFGCCCRNDISFDRNHINTIMAGATHGVSGGFIWLLQGSPLVDPLNWMHASPNSDKSYQCWSFLPVATTLEDAGESAYELGIMNNYIPNHSVAYNSGIDYKYADCRVNGFGYNGEYTICIENEGKIETDVNVKLSKALNRKFYRHIYRHNEAGEGNIIVAPCDKEVMIGDTVSEHIGKDYSFVVYTTIKPIRQVVMDKVDVRMKAGETLKLGATVIDGDEGAKPTFEISASLCDGAKYENGEIIVPPTAKKGDMFALKASLPTGEFGVSIVRIEENKNVKV